MHIYMNNIMTSTSSRILTGQAGWFITNFDKQELEFYREAIERTGRTHCTIEVGHNTQPRATAHAVDHAKNTQYSLWTSQGHTRGEDSRIIGDVMSSLRVKAFAKKLSYEFKVDVNEHAIWLDVKVNEKDIWESDQIVPYDMQRKTLLVLTWKDPWPEQYKNRSGRLAIDESVRRLRELLESIDSVSVDKTVEYYCREKLGMMEIFRKDTDSVVFMCPRSYLNHHSAISICHWLNRYNDVVEVVISE